MPYPINTQVPASLLHILRVRVGARRGARLLHDHLDKPDDVVTKAELACAAGADITIRRDIGGPVGGGYEQKVTVDFRTRIRGRAWNGRSIIVPALPASIAAGAAGQRIDELIDDPHLGVGTIESIEDHDDGSRILVRDETFSMRHVRPSYPVCLAADLRRLIRRRRLAKRLGNHYGFRLWTLPMAMLCSAAATLIMIFLFIAPADMSHSPHVGAITTAVLTTGPILGMTFFLWLLVGMVDDETAIENHARSTLEATRRDGLSSEKSQ